MEKNSLRLLVVDDEEAARYGIRRALEAFGHEIAEAESAEAARIQCPPARGSTSPTPRRCLLPGAESSRLP